MLELSDEAVDALKQIGTIRISAEEVDGDLEVAIDEAAEPGEGDQVIDGDGFRVFVAAAAADVLSDHVLGVHAHGDHFHFTFDERSD